MTKFERIAVSAPGKVLLSGGYLVTDRAYTGLVFGLDARIHVIVDAVKLDGIASATEPRNVEIVVESPQFTEAVWKYSCTPLDENRGFDVKQSGSESPNPFVEAAVRYGLSYVSNRRNETSRHFKTVSFTIVADDKYYSQQHTSTKCRDNVESEFHDFNVTLRDAHKTGLGSSAALVTAFVGALIQAFLHKDLEGFNAAKWKRISHGLAQAAHCAAQGKIGSGFDVACAVFGSCVYRRFSPNVLEKIGKVNSLGFASRLVDVVDDTTADGKPQDPPLWDMECDPRVVTMPQKLRLVMCDVDQGSSTPGMVRKVLEWRKAQPEAANTLWDRLEHGTHDLVAELHAMAKDEGRDLKALAETVEIIRQGVRQMSEQAGVPIEPREQTLLLDALTALPAVIGGVVPGAGGYDALAFIAEDSTDLTQLQAYLDGVVQGSRLALKQNGLPAPTGRVQILDIRPDMAGLTNESLNRYKGWIKPE